MSEQDDDSRIFDSAEMVRSREEFVALMRPDQAKPTALLPCPFCGKVPDGGLWKGSIGIWHTGSCRVAGSVFSAEEWNQRAHSPAQAEWLPIESAPFTGEPVLIAHGNSVWEDEWDAIEGCWQQCGRGGSHQGEVPSHWQHLPQPPKEQP